MISVLFTALLLLFGAAFARAQEPSAPRPAVQNELGFTVGIGSGELSDRVVSNVRSLVSAGLSVLQPDFPGLETKPFLVRVHESRDSMPTTLVRHLHSGSAGFALLGQHQIHLVWGEMRRTGADPQGVVTHELVHELLDQWVAPHGRGMPRWFHEGLAQVLAGDTYLGGREEDLLWRLAARRMLSFAELRDGFPLDPEDLQAAYAQSYSYVSWLVRSFGIGALLEAARDVDDSVAFERALVWATRRTTLQLEDAWRYHLTHESGASWRLLFDQCFNLLLIASLPLLVVAVVRRFARERRAAERLARAEQELALVTVAEPFFGTASDVGPDPTPGELHGPPLPDGFDDRAP